MKVTLKPLVALLLVGILGTACRSIPDVGPFAEATYDLAEVVEDSAAAVLQDLRVAEIDADADALQAALDPAFETLDALKRYADALSAVAAAGESGREQGEALADSLDGLVQSLGGALPGGLGQVLGIVNSWVAEVRAAESLAKAIERAHPVLVALEPSLDQLFGELRNLTDNGQRQFVHTMETQGKGIRVLDDLNSGDVVQSYRDAVFEIGRLQVASQEGELSEAQRDQLSTWQAVLAGLTPQYTHVAQLLEAKRTDYAALRESLTKAQALLPEWVAAHGALAKALREKKTPDLRRLQHDVKAIKAALAD